MKESHNFELAHLKKKKKERKTFWLSGNFWFGTFVMLFRVTWHVVGHEALENEWYVSIKAYKFTIFEILRDLLVLLYIACPCYPYIIL